MAVVYPLSELARSPTAALFEGSRDDVELSFYVTSWQPGEGPSLHKHPYAEVFLVEEGEALFESGGDELVVGGGHVVVVPAESPHRFSNGGEGVLRVTSLHPSRAVQTTWL